MELKIAGHTISTYNEVNINLKYDSIADTFSFKLYFDPTNETHKEIFKPGAYHKCTVSHGGVLLITGTVLSPRFASSGKPASNLVNISGYSVTGVLEDSCVLRTDPGTIIDINSSTIAVPPSTLQFDNLTLEQIASLVTGWYGISVKVDPELQKDSAFTTPYPQAITKPDQSVSEFLDVLAKQKNVILSHDRFGNLLLTRAKGNLLTNSTTLIKTNPTSFSSDIEGAPDTTGGQSSQISAGRAVLYDFSNPGQWTNMVLDFNGQKMHRVVQVVGQSSGGETDNALDNACANPYADLAVTRYKRVIQTSGDDNTTLATARSIVGDELKNIMLSIEIEGWELNGNLVTPNQIVEVRNPECFIYNKTKWFIQEVVFFGNEKEQTAILKCVPLSAFNNEEIVNVFE